MDQFLPLEFPPFTSKEAWRQRTLVFKESTSDDFLACTNCFLYTHYLLYKTSKAENNLLL